jgi:hypothetical protein
MRALLQSRSDRLFAIIPVPAALADAGEMPPSLLLRSPAFAASLSAGRARHPAAGIAPAGGPQSRGET